MPIPTPFHPRTSALCTSYRWKEWAGYYAVCSFDVHHDREYYAFRHASGMIDVSPLFKYEVTGPDAADFLSWIVTKNINKLKLGQVTYCCWCDEEGKVIDDGTIARLDDQHYRMTSALPTLYWLEKHRRGFDVSIHDSTKELAALSIQGPTSRDILRAASDADMDALKFFRVVKARVGVMDVWISRTGYTGDLGYEVWVKTDNAVRLWDALMEAGKPLGLEAAGLDAMDVTRIEAGFILNGVEYFSAPECLIDSRKSSPYEVGLGWTVNLKRDPFIGQAALKAEKKAGAVWSMVGLDMDWDEYEYIHSKYGLPPHVCSSAWRTGVPIYDEDLRHVGQATSGTWSPTLKKNISLATVKSEYAKIGTELQMEITVEYERHTVTARVSETPFFNPERKRA